MSLLEDCFDLVEMFTYIILIHIYNYMLLVKKLGYEIQYISRKQKVVKKGLKK